MTPSTLNLVWYILFLPLAGAAFQALLGKRIISAFGTKTGRAVMGTLGVLPIAIGFVLGLMITLALSSEGAAHSHVVTLYDWISLSYVADGVKQGLNIPFETLIDSLSMTMVLIITGVGALIHLYSIGYMGEERDFSRFFTYLNLFISCMLILVLANNLVLMFIGWEGVGLCSYLLIAFWYKDVSNAKAGNKAFIVNRIGDWGLTLGIFYIFAMLATHSGAWMKDGRWLSYDVILPNVGRVFAANPAATTAVALLLFVGACGKSAQFPLYFWLPDAMAGPTPVSALIHAATMVTAGVFLVNRMHIFYEMSNVASAVVACIGAFTALFAALIAFGQSDIKKVLAYSTVSQLGFMFLACGAGAFWAGMFHVTTHAFFKACLFLGSGAVIHAMMHNQDMRNYGRLWKYLPITCVTMFFAYLAISGVFPFAGYWSKEGIIGGAIGNQVGNLGQVNLVVISGYVALFVAMLTAWYMTRMTWLTFFGNEERWRAIAPHHAEHGHDAHGALSDPDHDTAHAHLADDGLHASPLPGVPASHPPHADPHGFFYTDEEMAARAEPAEEHHELDKTHTPREVPATMWLPLVVLAVLSIVGGWVLAHDEVFKNWLYPNGLTFLGELAPTEPEGLPLPLWALSSIAAGLGIVAGLAFYWKRLPDKEGWDMSKWNWFRRWAGNQFGYDNAVVGAGVEGGGEVGVAVWKLLDAGLVDGIVNGIGWLARQCGALLRRFQTGYVRNYAMSMTFGGLLIIAIALWAFVGVHLK